jgi:peptidoglycan/LPS O-acetylase OafA/YrhL
VQIKNLTGIRGVAALWVALYHFQSTASVALPFGPIAGGGAIGVDIFFVLSGFILALTYAARFAVPGQTAALYYDFIVRRFARIYPLHLVTFVAMLILWSVATRAGYVFQGNVQDDAVSAVCNLLMIHAWGLLGALSWNTPSWSVSAEWFAYLVIFPLCVLRLRHWRIHRVLLLTLLVWLAFVGYVRLLHAGQLAEAATDGALRIIPEFLAGYLAFRIVAAGRQPASGAGCMLAALSGIVAVLLQPAALPLLLPAILALMLALYAGGRWIDRVFGNRPIVWLGEISYSIYMVHVFVLIAANQVLRRFTIEPSTAHALLIVGLELTATLMAGYVGYRFVECPARAALARRLTRQRLQPRDLPVAARKPASPAPYLPNLQVMRFVAAFMVLLGHLLHETADHRVPLMHALRDRSGIEWGSGVDLFFVISGFVMYYLSYEKFGRRKYPLEFLNRRLVRVVPLYWLFTTLMLLALWQLPGQIRHADVSWRAVLASYFFYPMTRPDGLVRPILGLGWTLEYEMFFYACFALALLARRRIGMFALGAVFLIGAACRPWIPSGATPLLFWCDPVILEFALGILVAHLYRRGVRLSRPVQWLFMATGVGLMILTTPLGWNRLFWAGLPALLLVAGAALGPTWRARWMELGGDSSYSLYLSHPFTLNLLALLWIWLRLPPSGVLYVLSGMLACVLVGALVYQLVEAPLLKQLRRGAGAAGWRFLESRVALITGQGATRPGQLEAHEGQIYP